MNPLIEELKKHRKRSLPDFALPGIAYYVISIKKLQSIIENGIKSRNQVIEEGILINDLSLADIQRKREKQQYLKASSGKAESFAIHDCINLFVNPYNGTINAFRRKALYNDDDICILCLDIDNFESFIGVSNKNLAAAGSKCLYSVTGMNNQGQWDIVFSKSGDNKYRSAEILIHIKSDKGYSSPLTIKPVAILIPAGVILPALSNLADTSCVKEDKEEVFGNLDSIFYFESKMSESYVKLQGLGR